MTKINLTIRKPLDMVHKNDIVLSIGGDNYCYADVNKYIMLHNMMISRGARQYYGDVINPEVLRVIRKLLIMMRQYQLITARNLYL